MVVLSKGNRSANSLLDSNCEIGVSWSDTSHRAEAAQSVFSLIALQPVVDATTSRSANTTSTC